MFRLWENVKRPFKYTMPEGTLESIGDFGAWAFDDMVVPAAVEYGLSWAFSALRTGKNISTAFGFLTGFGFYSLGRSSTVKPNNQTLRIAQRVKDAATIYATTSALNVAASNQLAEYIHKKDPSVAFDDSHFSPRGFACGFSAKSVLHAINIYFAWNDPYLTQGQKTYTTSRESYNMIFTLGQDFAVFGGLTPRTHAKETGEIHDYFMLGQISSIALIIGHFVFAYLDKFFLENANFAKKITSTLGVTDPANALELAAQIYLIAEGNDKSPNVLLKELSTLEKSKGLPEIYEKLGITCPNEYTRVEELGVGDATQIQQAGSQLTIMPPPIRDNDEESLLTPDQKSQAPVYGSN